ncbi:cytochrome P450 724B1-like [Phragmites australis]|uniref:cytochrome P450 724B1-like n=1 Tax=Phragmites australis TaxID=29695 RepID=UPI002D77297E|nr:cytochrome P450 724B1-like [Phragmites australis]
MVTVLLVAFVALCLLAAVVFRHFMPLHHNPGAPRGSFGWPLVGETIGFLCPHASNTTGAFLHDHITRYGPVFKSHLFGAPTVVSCDEELNHFVLQNEERLFQCSYPGPIRGILGKSSLLVVTGEHHRRIRGMALAFVASTGLRPSYLADVDRAARAVVASWRGCRAVAFCGEARKFAFSVIVEQVLGLSPDEPVTGRILQDYSTFMKGLISFPLNIPGTSYARAVEARRNISLTLEAIMEERRNGGTFKKVAFLDVLLSNNELSHDDKVTFVLDSLLAGYETTSILVSMAVYFLGQSPKCLEQLKREHESIRSSKGKEEFLTAEDYKKMEYTQRVINETMRCGNIVKFVHRKALKDVRYKEYMIPAGWKVLPILGAVHLDPALHANPQEFQPCRWEGLNQTPGKKFAPFGGGLRLCPGSELGKVEVAFFLHHLVLNYRWRMDGEDVPMAHPYVEFKRGLPIEIWRQSDHPTPWFVTQ